MICWVRIAQRIGYELIESGYETSELGYESCGYERSMGTKRLDTVICMGSNPVQTGIFFRLKLSVTAMINFTN